MSSSPGYEKEKERDGKDRDTQRDDEDEEKCYNCGGTGHFRRECVSSKGSADLDIAPACHHCKGKGHFARICPTIAKARLKESCYNCGMPGHRSFECHAKMFMPSMGGKDACYSCGMPGHKAADCTTKSMGGGYGRGGRGGPVRGMGGGREGRGMASPYPAYPGYPGGYPYAFNPLAAAYMLMQQQMPPYGGGYPPMMGGGGRGRGSSRDSSVCYSCNQPGHFARDCPNSRQS